MLKRVDKYSPGELKRGFHVKFADADDEERPYAYEGEVVVADGPSLRVMLTDVQPIGGGDTVYSGTGPGVGDEVSLIVTDVSACRELPRE